MDRAPFTDLSNHKPTTDGELLKAVDMNKPEDMSKIEKENNTSEKMGNEFPPTQSDSLVARMAGPSSGKAGLGNCDKEAINRKIYELSKGSKFFENEKKKDEVLSKKIEGLLEKYNSLSMTDLSCNLPYLNQLEQEYENSRDLSQIIVHVDMDAFYASVEILDNPALEGKPVAVGGMSMLSTASYEARKYGVRSAMPGFIAKELCPELIIVPCNFARYTEMSKQIQEVFSLYDPDYRQMSLDEAYLNITEYCHNTLTDPEEAVTQLRQAIFEKTKLTASAGIAANTLIAKICSDFNKPNGQTIVPFDRESIISFMAPLSIRKISGIGRVTERVLNAVGVKTCQDAYDRHVILFRLFSEKTFNFIFASCLGISSNDLSSEHVRKSISTERTFQTLSSWDDLMDKLKEISNSLASSLSEKRLSGKTVTLKIKTPEFEVKVRSKTFPRPLASQLDLFNAGKKLLEQEYPISARLMGLRLSNLSDCESDPASDSKITKYFAQSDKTQLQSVIKVESVHLDSSSDVEIIESSSEKPRPTENSEPISINSISCPVCSKKFSDSNGSLEQLNLHLDKCLQNTETSFPIPQGSLKRKKLPHSTPKGNEFSSFFPKTPKNS